MKSIRRRRAVEFKSSEKSITQTTSCDFLQSRVASLGHLMSRLTPSVDILHHAGVCLWLNSPKPFTQKPELNYKQRLAQVRWRHPGCFSTNEPTARLLLLESITHTLTLTFPLTEDTGVRTAANASDFHGNDMAPEALQRSFFV